MNLKAQLKLRMAMDRLPLAGDFGNFNNQTKATRCFVLRGTMSINRRRAMNDRPATVSSRYLLIFELLEPNTWAPLNSIPKKNRNWLNPRQEYLSKIQPPLE